MLKRVTARSGKANNRSRARALLPSPDAATNLLIADIVLRSAARLFRENVERGVARASRENEDEARELTRGKSLIKTAALYGASRLATRSPLGLGIVAGGLALKTLYDIGKAREERLRTQAKRGPSSD